MKTWVAGQGFGQFVPGRIAVFLLVGDGFLVVAGSEQAIFVLHKQHIPDSMILPGTSRYCSGHIAVKQVYRPSNNLFIEACLDG